MDENKTIREQIESYLGTITAKDMFIIDWGSGRKRAQKRIHVENCKVIAIDKRENRNPDMVLDICVPQKIGQADMAFCTEVLEHCIDPGAALTNIFNNLKKEGILILSVPFVCGVHSYEDYWRFTKQGIQVLIEKYGFKIIDLIHMKYEEKEGYLVKAQKP